ncbi:MAG TPA: hypothetical protein ENI63_01880 [Candidatus Kaiserbacteria bacterium]|nr:hypothetical protein [Candidatus Kaiserbacteria bacterium]
MAQTQRRMVYSKIWVSIQFTSMSDKAKLLFIGMVTLADDDGRLIGNPAYLRGQIFSFDEEISVLEIKKERDEVEKSGLIEVYKIDGIEYILHPNWEKYQVIRGDLYTPSTLPDRNGIVTKPTQKSTLSKDKISKDKISKLVVKNKKTKIVKYTQNDMVLVDLFISLIQKNNPEWKMRGNRDIWAEDINKLQRLDERTYEQIEVMIKWVQSDLFWRQNILSTSKLREKFNDLIPKLKGFVEDKRSKRPVVIK